MYAHPKVEMSIKVSIQARYVPFPSELELRSQRKS